MDSMAAGASVAVTHPSPIGGPARRLRVLVVDDDADSREVLEETVARLGHQSAGAHDGVEALAKQQAHPVDVILSDWSMPGMTGIELCRRVRSRESAEYTYFVFMTGFGDRAFSTGSRACAPSQATVLRKGRPSGRCTHKLRKGARP